MRLKTLRPALLFVFVLFSTGAHAQWFNFPTPATPDTRR